MTTRPRRLCLLFAVVVALLPLAEAQGEPPPGAAQGEAALPASLDEASTRLREAIVARNPAMLAALIDSTDLVYTRQDEPVATLSRTRADAPELRELVEFLADRDGEIDGGYAENLGPEEGRDRLVFAPWPELTIEFDFAKTDAGYALRRIAVTELEEP